MDLQKWGSPRVTFGVTFYLFDIPKTLKGWSWREELNLQPAVYKTAALPLSYASLRGISLTYVDDVNRRGGEEYAKKVLRHKSAKGASVYLLHHSHGGAGKGSAPL